jgi:4'-phosphopantetheinyl transferase
MLTATCPAALSFATPAEVRDPLRRARLLAALSAEEMTRLGRLQSQAKRDLFLVAHGLLRQSLSIHCRVAPEAVRFRVGPHGRPEITPLSDLRFSLSHTRGLAACAVAVGAEIGIDIEDTSRQRSARLADRFFSARERRDLEVLSIPDRQARFYEYWTLKEAYLKARGVGLTLPLDAFSFFEDAAGRWRIEFDSGIKDDPGRWRFASWRIGRRHQAALAMALDASPDEASRRCVRPDENVSGCSSTSGCEFA